MKKYLIVLTLLTSIVFYGQTLPILRTVTAEQCQQLDFSVQKGDYIKDVQNNLDKYIGTWVYNNSGTIFTLKLERVNSFLLSSDNAGTMYYYEDAIVIRYKLIKNNQVLFDNLESATSNALTFTDYRGVLENLESNSFISGTFKDFTNNVFVSRCKIKRLLNAIGAPMKITFMLYPNYSSRLNPKEFYQGMTSIFSMPNNIELIRTN